MMWDEELSSGGMINSNNARPIPQVYVGLPKFTLVPYTVYPFFAALYRVCREKSKIDGFRLTALGAGTIMKLRNV